MMNYIYKKKKQDKNASKPDNITRPCDLNQN